MRIEWTDEGRSRLNAVLAVANERRTARVLTLAQLEACAERAVQSALGFDWVRGSDTGDARALNSVALAVVREGKVVVSAGRAHGTPTPAQVWADLRAWDGWEPTANRPACLAWAGRARVDRVAFALLPDRQTTPLSDGDALLADVLARPDELGPRLVLADALSERGDARGEFIALQCACRDDGRSQELLSTHLEHWAPEAAHLRVSFSRGFVDDVYCNSLERLVEVERLARREPVQHLHFATSRPVDVARLAAHPLAQRLATLELHLTNGAERDADTVLLALSTSRWPALRTLGFHGHQLGDPGLHRLAQFGGQSFPKLVELLVEEDSVTAAGVGELLTQRWSGRLERLVLNGNLLGPSGAETLASSTRLRALTTLCLDDNNLGNDGAAALAGSSLVRRLEALSLRRNRITGAGFEALQASPHLDGLHRLELAGNPLGGKAWKSVRQRWSPQ